MFRGMTFRLERGDDDNEDEEEEDDDDDSNSNNNNNELAVTLRTHGGALSTRRNMASHIVLSKQGSEYETALGLVLQKPRDIKIVTPLWIHDCVSAGHCLPAWPSAVVSVEHRPVPNRPAPDAMKRLSIAVSGYRGRDKAILERLVKALGASFTRELTMQQTHLICAEPSGAKYAFAQSLDKDAIKIVNHRWLEDCFWRWQYMDEHSYELLIGGSVGGREFAPAEMDLQRLVQQEDKGEDENEDEDDVVRVLESGPSSPDDVEQEEDNAPCGDTPGTRSVVDVAITEDEELHPQKRDDLKACHTASPLAGYLDGCELVAELSSDKPSEHPSVEDDLDQRQKTNKEERRSSQSCEIESAKECISSSEPKGLQSSRIDLEGEATTPAAGPKAGKQEEEQDKGTLVSAEAQVLASRGDPCLYGADRGETPAACAVAIDSQAAETPSPSIRKQQGVVEKCQDDSALDLDLDTGNDNDRENTTCPPKTRRLSQRARKLSEKALTGQSIRSRNMLPKAEAKTKAKAKTGQAQQLLVEITDPDNSRPARHSRQGTRQCFETTVSLAQSQSPISALRRRTRGSGKSSTAEDEEEVIEKRSPFKKRSRERAGRSKPKEKPLFVSLSCMSAEEVEDMSSIISELDFIELIAPRRSPGCTERATHVVVGSPITRTAKVLEGLASGLWIVKPSWIYACVEAGKQAPEASHEWSQADASKSTKHTVDLDAPRFWRERRSHGGSSALAFSHQRVCIVGSSDFCPDKIAVLEHIITAGGGILVARQTVAASGAVLRNSNGDRGIDMLVVSPGVCEADKAESKKRTTARLKPVLKLLHDARDLGVAIVSSEYVAETLARPSTSVGRGVVEMRDCH